jgi:hypothetical protein
MVPSSRRTAPEPQRVESGGASRGLVQPRKESYTKNPAPRYPSPENLLESASSCTIPAALLGELQGARFEVRPGCEVQDRDLSRVPHSCAGASTRMGGFRPWPSSPAAPPPCPSPCANPDTPPASARPPQSTSRSRSPRPPSVPARSRAAPARQTAAGSAQ